MSSSEPSEKRALTVSWPMSPAFFSAISSGRIEMPDTCPLPFVQLAPAAFAEVIGNSQAKPEIRSRVWNRVMLAARIPRSSEVQVGLSTNAECTGQAGGGG